MARDRTRRPGLLSIAAVALVAALIGGGVAFAGGQSFSDVPPSNPFFNEIEAINTAGITTGFPDGTYRPNQTVTRGAMAAFMGRGFGRAAYDTDTDSNPSDGSNVTGAGVTIAAGAADSARSGFVVVTGTAQMSTLEADCQCALAMEVIDATDNVIGSTRTSLSNDVNVIGLNVHSSTAQARFAIQGTETHTYVVRMRATTAGANTAITLTSDIVATYVPFNGSGNTPS